MFKGIPQDGVDTKEIESKDSSSNLGKTDNKGESAIHPTSAATESSSTKEPEPKPLKNAKKRKVKSANGPPTKKPRTKKTRATEQFTSKDSNKEIPSDPKSIPAPLLPTPAVTSTISGRVRPNIRFSTICLGPFYILS